MYGEGISMLGTCETMNLGIRMGLGAKLLADVLNVSSGRCWSSEVYNPVPGVCPAVPPSKHYENGFATALMTKDLGLAVAAATEASAPVVMGGLAHQLYRYCSEFECFLSKLTHSLESYQLIRIWHFFL